MKKIAAFTLVGLVGISGMSAYALHHPNKGNNQGYFDNSHGNMVTTEVNRTFNVKPNASLTVDNINGNVDITTWSRDEVQINAVIAASNEERLEQVEVQFSQSGNHIDVNTDYQRSWGKQFGHAKVTYTIQVPNYIELDKLDLVNGNLTIEGVEGEISASLVNGSVITDNASANADIETVNGKIELTYREDLARTNAIELESVNGSLELNLPADVNATVKASTVHGAIKNEFGLPVKKGRYVGSDLRGEIGNGDIRISLDNVNGSIKINKI